MGLRAILRMKQRESRSYNSAPQHAFIAWCSVKKIKRQRLRNFHVWYPWHSALHP